MKQTPKQSVSISASGQVGDGAGWRRVGWGGKVVIQVVPVSASVRSCAGKDV